MLENVKGDTAIVVTFGAAACMLSLLVLMGLKLKWFRARMSFDQAPKEPEVAYVGVYRSTYTDAFEYRRPSTLPPLPSPAFTPGPSAAAAAVASKLAASRLPSTSMPNLTTVTELNEMQGTANGKKGKETKVKEVKEVKEPKAKEVKEPKVKEVKEKKVKEVKEQKVKAVKEPKVKEVKEVKGNEVKEAKAKEVKEKKAKEVKEPKVKEVKEMKVKEVKEPKVKDKKEPKVKEVKTKEPKVKEPKVKVVKEKGTKKKKESTEAQISQNNAFVNVQSSSSVSQSPKQGTPRSGAKTFSSMQSEGDLTPIPKRVIRNPVAMGAQTYQPPPMGMMIDSTYDNDVYADINITEAKGAKAWGASQQYLNDMDEESET